MFTRFKAKAPGIPGSTVTFRLGGMHCASCALNIDDTLQDIDGVISAATSYPKSTTTVTFDPQATSPDTIKKAIKDLGYTPIPK